MEDLSSGLFDGTFQRDLSAGPYVGESKRIICLGVVESPDFVFIFREICKYYLCHFSLVDLSVGPFGGTFRWDLMRGSQKEKYVWGLRNLPISVHHVNMVGGCVICRNE